MRRLFVGREQDEGAGRSGEEWVPSCGGGAGEGASCAGVAGEEGPGQPLVDAHRRQGLGAGGISRPVLGRAQSWAAVKDSMG